ncbi:hypothetical protein SAMN04487996_12253 [Dyadobacter soli]|uniref:Uncharacterized protein n=1 Tax=Dyadobacter soli TaxID=659014 RepID=A0A1G7WK42_9BACT|nr:hypothetical protein [Dyadobacter soli]SDG71560.1 hypothetical protein SAMN04487996_12253 [Dyadobacter soli]
MDIKKLKASLQLAEMRLRAAPSDATQALYDQAKEAYDALANSKVEKNAQVSGTTGGYVAPANPVKPGDAAGENIISEKDRKVSKIVATLADLAGDQPTSEQPSTTAATGDAVPVGENEEKKTEEQPVLQA